MATVLTPRITDLAKEVNISWTESKNSFYQQVKAAIPKLQSLYVQRVFSLVDENEIKTKIKSLGSKIEPLILVDENDAPIQGRNGWWTTEFRQDFWNIAVIPESREYPLFSRIALFLLEDEKGNIVVSRRSMKKSSPGELELAGGHVTAGDSYLETIYKELGEELQYQAPEGSITEADRLFKYRNFTPWEGELKGKGNILSLYRVKVPNQESLIHDPEEIEELITLTKPELFEAISTGSLRGETYKFAPHHAYWYLEYLEQSGINTQEARKNLEERGVMKNRTKISTFSDSE